MNTDMIAYAARGPMEAEQIDTMTGVKEWYVHSQREGITILARVSAFTWDKVYLEFRHNNVLCWDEEKLRDNAIRFMLNQRGFDTRDNKVWTYKEISLSRNGLWSVQLPGKPLIKNLRGPGECIRAIDNAMPYAYFDEDYHNGGNYEDYITLS